jgi:hypothetical protein
MPVLTLALALLLAASPDAGSKPEGRAIFDAAAARAAWGFFISRGTEAWTPTAADVDKLEAALPALLDRERPPAESRPPSWRRAAHYKRQYFGYVKHRRRFIHANFFCSVPSGVDWRLTPVVTKDGGDCYFNVDYDPRTGQFSNLQVNGVA